MSNLNVIPGIHHITAIAFEILPGASEYWSERLHRHSIETKTECRFGETVIRFSDPHGLYLELIAAAESILPVRGSADSAAALRIKGFHSATSTLRDIQGTKNLLVNHLGMKLQGQEENRYRFVMNGGTSPAGFYDLVIDAEAGNGRQGGGTVHHIAFRTPDENEQLSWQRSLRESGYSVTAVRDRKYFKSIYFHEPGGVLFEIATDTPGFAVDEPQESLGQALKLPERFESIRAEIENHLVPLPTNAGIRE